MPNLDMLNRQAQEYNAGLEDYQQGAMAYQNDVTKYNKAVAAFNAPGGPQADYDKRVKQYNKIVADLERKRNNLSNAAAAVRYAEQANVVAGWIDSFNKVTLPEAQARMAALNVGKAPELGMAKPEFTAQAPKDPGFTKQQMDTLAGKQNPVAQAAADPSAQQGLIARMQGQARPDSIIGGILQNARYST